MNNNNNRTLPIMGKCELFTTPKSLTEYISRMSKAFNDKDIVPVNVLVNGLIDYYDCIINQLKGNNPNVSEYKTFDLQDFLENSIKPITPQMQSYAYTLAYGMTNYYYELIIALESKGENNE